MPEYASLAFSASYAVLRAGVDFPDALGVELREGRFQGMQALRVGGGLPRQLLELELHGLHARRVELGRVLQQPHVLARLVRGPRAGAHGVLQAGGVRAYADC